MDWWSVRKLHAHMTEKGLRSKSGRMLAISSFHEMLTNPFYAGFIWFNGKLLRGQHQPIVSSPDLEAAALSLRGLVDKTNFNHMGHKK